MAKRIADTQMTREALEAAGSDEKDTTTPSQEGFKQASSEVLSKRRIAQPRKRKNLGFGNGTGNGNGFGNQQAPAANAFSFGQSSPAASSNATTSNAFASVNAPKSVSEPASVSSTDIPAKRNALNLQFQTKLSEYISNDPCADLSSVCDQYKSHFQDIMSTQNLAKTQATTTSNPEPKSTAPAVAPAPDSTANKINAVPESDSDSESDAEIKVQGPTFTLSEKPTAKNSVFSFGPKKTTKADTSDSESDVEIKGPSFSFKPSAASATAKPVFKFSSGESRKSSTDNIGDAETINATTKQAPKFSFGASSKPFGSTEKPTSVSDTSSSEQPPKASFGFAQPSKNLNTSTETQEAKTPSFSFGANTAAKSDSNGVKSKPAFSFGQTASTANTEKAAEKPAFKFGASNTSVNSDDTVKKPSFAFGASTASGEKAEETPTKETEKASGEKTEKPSFSFGFSASSNDSATSGSNGNNLSSTKPAPFSFGSTPGSDESTKPKPKPSFVFGQKSETQQSEVEKPKPSFTFGSANTSSAPSFTFGKPAEVKETPSSGFKFSLPFSSASASTEISNNTKEPQPENTVATELQPEEETKTMTMTNGEEGEALLFSKRAKLLLVNPDTKGYDSKGTGELKLLQDKDDKTKVRILCRSDGMGHVLLNTSVVKAFQYVPADAERENFVKCPVVNGEGKLENYVLQVKQKADGRQLCKSIKEAQDGM
ncbi:LAFA_0A01552g1_1 [Lachancea sp. 'fantastica']|nr:LAFA_0A01552g1_1 [Lachancea sp. 'fantastica']